MRVKVHGIGVIGPEWFCEHTQNAINTLRSKDKKNYHQVKAAFRIIILSKITGGANYKEKVFHVGPKTAMYNKSDVSFSLIWYASCIAHDANHIILARKRGDHKQSPLRIMNKMELEKEELLCCQIQKTCLDRIGGDERHFQGIDDSINNRYWEIHDRTW